MLQAHQPLAAHRRPGTPVMTTCPKCRATHVRALTETALYVHLGCQACRHVWSRPERRTSRRPLPQTGADFLTIR
jgi:hypothetical protein